MEYKRDGLVPVAKVIDSPGVPVPAIREASTQARRGFTQADQVEQLVRANEADTDLGLGLPRFSGQFLV